MPDSTICPVCQQRKPKKLCFCKECFGIYGNDVDDWPEWLRVLRNDTERWRYDDQIANENELPFGDDDLDEDEDPGFDEPLFTRHVSEMSDSYLSDGCGHVLLPYAPYGDNEEMNKAYRKANGIKATLSH